MRKRALGLFSRAAQGKDVSGCRRLGPSLSHRILYAWLYPVVEVCKII